MKVCIPFEGRGVGGPSTFVGKLGRALRARGHVIAPGLTHDCDVLLAIVSAPMSLLIRAKRYGVPIVQRLDGIYYSAVSGWRWPILDLPIWTTYRFFADWVVYQSDYSQRMCEHFFGPTPCPTSVVRNGVDLERFSPCGEGRQLTDGRTILCLLATFWRESEIAPVIRAYDELRARHPGPRRAVVGRLVPSISHLRENRPDVVWLGQVPHEELPSIYRGASLMVSAKLRAPCPNIVIEAMACGLPIACLASGSHTELIGEQGGICIPIDNDFGPFPEVDASALADASERVLQARERFAVGARRRCEAHFALDRMAEGYLAAFKKVAKRHGR